jgi:peptidoglycan/LPS O-acetylase OafA/YrhL
MSAVPRSGEQSSVPASARRYNSCLDLLRGAAAQLVLWDHCVAIIMIPAATVPTTQWLQAHIFRGVGRYGHEAVVVFFVLSGYLIGGDVRGRMRKGAFAPGPYAVNRLGRLYSVVAPGLILAAVLDTVSFRFGAGREVLAINTQFWPPYWQDLKSLSAGTFWCNLAFLQTIECRQFGVNSSLWSLSNELFYYAILPSALLAYWAKSHRVRIVATAVLALFLGEILRSGFMDPERPYIYLAGLLLWLGGAYTSLIFSLLPRVLRGPIGLLLGVVIAFGANRAHFRSAIADLCVALLIMWIVFRAELVESWLRWLPGLARKLIPLFSNYSYSLYFLHMPLLFAFLSFVPALRQPLQYDLRGCALLIALILVLNILSFAFYYLFERHYHRLQKWGREHLPAWATAVVPVRVTVRQSPRGVAKKLS